MHLRSDVEVVGLVLLLRVLHDLGAGQEVAAVEARVADRRLQADDEAASESKESS